MRARQVLLAFGACAMTAAGSGCSNSGTDESSGKPAIAEPARTSAWTATYPRGAASRGKQMYEQFCAACHGPPPPPGGPPGGPPMGGPMGGPAVPPGTAELQVKYGGTMPADLEQRTDLTAETVALFVRRGTGVMPAIRKTELSDADLKSIADYLGRGK